MNGLSDFRLLNKVPEIAFCDVRHFLCQIIKIGDAQNVLDLLQPPLPKDVGQTMFPVIYGRADKVLRSLQYLDALAIEKTKSRKELGVRCALVDWAGKKNKKKKSISKKKKARIDSQKTCKKPMKKQGGRGRGISTLLLPLQKFI